MGQHAFSCQATHCHAYVNRISYILHGMSCRVMSCSCHDFLLFGHVMSYHGSYAPKPMSALMIRRVERVGRGLAIPFYCTISALLPLLRLALHPVQLSLQVDPVRLRAKVLRAIAVLTRTLRKVLLGRGLLVESTLLWILRRRALSR